MLEVKVSKKIRFEKFTIPQQEMLRLGTVGVDSIKARIGAGRNVFDAPAKPLSKAYARRKIRAGKKPIRDLTLTGKMMGAFRVRQVGPFHVIAGFGGERNKARSNEQREPFAGFSESNRRSVLQKGQEMLNRIKERLIRVLPGGAS